MEQALKRDATGAFRVLLRLQNENLLFPDYKDGEIGCQEKKTPFPKEEAGHRGIKDDVTSQSRENREMDDVERAIEDSINEHRTSICRQCSLLVIDDDPDDDSDDDRGDEKDVDHQEEEGQHTGEVGCEDEDSPDGPGIAQIEKVVRKCTCRLRSVLRKRVGEDVLCPTLIIKKYHECQDKQATPRTEPVVKKSSSRDKFSTFFRCVQAQKSVDLEDAVDFSQTTTVLNISDPAQGDSGRGEVALGAVVVTLKDERGKLRHFVEEVSPGSAAQDMELMVEDELLLLNDILLVDVSAEKLEELFADVNINEEFTMFTRRVVDMPRGITTDEMEYEYWKVRVTLNISIEEGIVVPEKVSFTKATKGDIVIFGEAFIRQAYIESCRGYLYNADGVLKIHPQLVTSDQSFRFEKLSYNAAIIGKASWKSRKIEIFRSSSGGSTYFLHMNKKGKIKLMECPQNLSTTPVKEDISGSYDQDNFSIRNTIFFEHKVSKSKRRVFLESQVEIDHYLCLDTNDYTLSLLEEKNRFLLNYRDDVKFNYHDL